MVKESNLWVDRRGCCVENQELKNGRVVVCMSNATAAKYQAEASSHLGHLGRAEPRSDRHLK